MTAIMLVLLFLPPMKHGKQDWPKSEVTQRDMAQINTTCVYMNASDSPFLTVPASSPSSLPVGGSTVNNCQFCHALVLGQTVVSQGCWAQGDGCSTPCTLSSLFPPSLVLKVKYPGMEFCCCSGDRCNKAWQHPHRGSNSQTEPGCGEASSIVLSGVEIVLLIVVGVLLVLIVILLVLVSRPVPAPVASTQFLLKLSPPRQHTLSTGWGSLESLLEGGIDNG